MPVAGSSDAGRLMVMDTENLVPVSNVQQLTALVFYHVAHPVGPSEGSFR